MIRYIIGTESGSVYVVRRNEAEGEWFLSGKNVVNPESVALEGEIAIDPPVPWPPRVGEACFLGTYRPDDRAGREGCTRFIGKITSRVESFSYTDVEGA